MLHEDRNFSISAEYEVGGKAYFVSSSTARKYGKRLD